MNKTVDPNNGNKLILEDQLETEGVQLNIYSPDIFLDIPVPYVIYEICLNENKTKVIDTRYYFVNKAYCKLVGKEKDQLVGKNFREVFPEKDTRWFKYCYNAFSSNQIIHDKIYSTEIQHWLNFTVGPVSEKGYLAFTFMYADAEHAEKMLLTRNRMTDSISLNVSKILNDEGNFEAACYSKFFGRTCWLGQS